MRQKTNTGWYGLSQSVRLFIINIGFVSLLLLLPLLYYSLTQGTAHCHVTDKEAVISNNYSKYLIYCDDEVLQNTDSLWGWKWDSSDMYRQIRVGETYNFDVYGKRIPILSMYRDILRIR